MRYCRNFQHARLSIIDIAGGDQPIRNEDGTIQLVFNGEIFNYLELRKTLIGQGHRFYTHSDTEVIVHLYEEYGLDFLQHLNGQFAIALWDTRLQRLVLARDRVGIRPLFYVENAKRLYFASEVKSIFTQPSIPRRIDPQALQEIFTFWSPLAPNSLFKDIKSLPPGHIMVIDKNGQQIKPYWDWAFPNEAIDTQKSADDWAEELRELMIDSVRLQLRADVPVGAYLSGGLDSSVITSLIKNFTETPLRTFSIGFEDKEFDESRYQDELVKFLETDHTHVFRFWSHAQDSDWRPLILKRLYPYLKHSPTKSGSFTQQFFQQGLEESDKPYFSHIPRWATTRRSLQFLSKEMLASIDHKVTMEDAYRILPEDIASWKPLNRDQYVEAKTLLSGYLLCSQGDRVAMANSIEGRFPFLDHRVIEFAARMPSRYKIMGLNEKYILKRSMKGFIPDSINQRSKQPYRAPDSQSFFTEGKPLDFVDDLFSESRLKSAGYFNPKMASLLMNKCRKGKVFGFADNMAFIGILSCMLVDEIFIAS
ncbi:MAG: asparagine synthase (glutamine-hydrolyzing) [Candidatus Thiodiazotropha sp.]